MKSSSDNEVEVEKGHLKVSYSALVVSLVFTAGMIVTIAGGVWTAAISYSRLVQRIDGYHAEAVMQVQFRGWSDTLRERNESLPLKVPPLPELPGNAFKGDIAISETKVASNRKD